MASYEGMDGEKKGCFIKLGDTEEDLNGGQAWGLGLDDEVSSVAWTSQVM